MVMILQTLHGVQKFDETPGKFYVNFVEKIFVLNCCCSQSLFLSLVI